MYTVEGNPDSDIICEWYVKIWSQTSYTGEHEAVICKVAKKKRDKRQTKQKVEKSNKSQHFDANADMSKLLRGVTAGDSKALQRLTFFIIDFCVIDDYTIMCIIPLASEIQTGKKDVVTYI